MQKGEVMKMKNGFGLGKRQKSFARAVAVSLSVSMVAGGMAGDSLLVLAQTPQVSGNDVSVSGNESGGGTVTGNDLLLERTVSGGNLYAGRMSGDYTQFLTDQLIADWRMGTDITAGNGAYDAARGYGFSTVEYSVPAPGWEGGVYHAREAQYSQGAGYVADGSGCLAVGSKVWTETVQADASTTVDFTYENTSAFDFDLANADYQVDVTFSNPTDAEYSASVEAEDITKAGGIKVGAGGSATASFQAVLLDGQLNLKFLSDSAAKDEAAAAVQNVYISRIAVTRLATQQAGEKPTIYVASDSTVQTYEKGYYPQAGWGETLHNFFGSFLGESSCEDCNYGQSRLYETSNVIIENRAIGGRSSRSFVQEGKLDDLLEDIKVGDYLLVQWGHNDSTKTRPNRYVSVEEFENWMMYYVNGALQRGATPVLVTPVARYSYKTGADGQLTSFNSDFEAYRQVMLRMAESYGIPLVDLTQRSIDVCNSFGIEGAKSLFLHLAAGEYENFPGGSTDSTHLQYYGAYKFAQCVAKGILESTNPALDGLKGAVELNIPSKVPGKIADLKVTTVGSSSISLMWEKEADAELTYIYRHELLEGETIEDVDFTLASKYSATSNNMYTDSGCESGKTYVYAVRGFNEKGLGELSEKVEASTKAANYRFDFNYNNSPTMDGWIGVNQDQAYGAYDQTFQYGWLKAPNGGRSRGNNGNADSSPMADDFCMGEGEFAVALPNGDYEVTIYSADLLPGTSNIKNSYTAEGLAHGSTNSKQALSSCTASVRVTDGQLNIGVGGQNKVINGMTITELQLAPSGLAAQEMEVIGSKATFLLLFNDLKGADSYNVYRKNSTDTKFSLLTNITAQQLAGTEGLGYRTMTGDTGETYYYYVSALMEDGSETAPSETLVVKLVEEGDPAPAPVNVRCVSPLESATQLQKYIDLEWDAVQDAIKYVVYRYDKQEGDKGYQENGFVKVGETTTASFHDTADVATNIHYYYKVAAFTKTGMGLFSEICQSPVTGTLVPVSPEKYTDRALTAINLAGSDGGQINVSAAGPDGEELTTGIFLSWRSFGADFDQNNNLTTTFDVYRDNVKINTEPLTHTNLVDQGGTKASVYKVVGSNDQVQGLLSVGTKVWADKFMEFDLYCPDDQVMPDNSVCTYSANDMSVGDLDGDGALELIVKWSPSNAKDNSFNGYTGTTILDGYDIDFSTGKVSLLWRIDLGVNIRSGAHYTQFQVWDYDGDGKAEIAVKTADGSTTYKSTDGTLVGLTETSHIGACSSSELPTNVISPVNDYRNTAGYVLKGAEYFTIFNGEDGTELDTTEYLPGRGEVGKWGDTQGNRVDRFLSATAYLDGETPFAVFCRGYYTRTCLTAYYLKDTNGDHIGDTLAVWWEFDTNEAGTQYEGQGNHGIAVNDVDNDGKDEIIYGALVIDHNGTVKYSTGLGHGDSMHVSDWVSWNEGLEIMSVHEHVPNSYHVEIHDAQTGEVLMGYPTGKDTGRGVAADIDPTSEGAEWWGAAGPNYSDPDEPAWDSTKGQVLSSWSKLGNENLIKLADSTPASNFTIFWDGDLLSEVLDHKFNEKPDYLPVGVVISKWNYEEGKQESLLYSEEVWSSNGTKGNPGLAADILGDWRDEIVVRSSSDNNKVRVYSTTIRTDYVVPCQMENLAYREAVAWQNVGYNQPANLSYLLSKGLVTANLSKGATGYDYADINFTEASDSAYYGHEITQYDIFRAEGSGEYEKIARVDKEDLKKVTDGVEENPGEDAFEVLYSNDFESGVTDFTNLRSTSYEVVEADKATVNANRSGNVYSILGDNSGGKETGANSPAFTDFNADGLIVNTDFRLDAGAAQGKDTVFSLQGSKNKDNWLSSTAQIINIIGKSSASNGYFASIAINGVDITQKALISNGTNNQEASGLRLNRDTTGWLNLQAKLNFTKQQAEVVLTRISDGSEVYKGTLDFVNQASSLQYLFCSAAKIYGVVSLDNIRIGMEKETTPSEPGNSYYVYKDKTTKPNTSYSYKIAAVVDGSASHMSSPLAVKTHINIVTVKDIVLEDLVEGTPLPEGKTIADLLPATVRVVDSDNREQDAQVTWDTAGADINKAGQYTVTASIDGYSKKVEALLKVIPNKITGFVPLEDIEVIQGMNVTLPGKIQILNLNTTTLEADVTWDTSSLDTGKLGTYRLQGTVAGMEQKAEINILVIGNYIASIPDLYPEIVLNTENVSASMPSRAEAVWGNGDVSQVNVTWTGLDAIDTSKTGEYSVTGTVIGFQDGVTARVEVVYPAVYRFDFGITSGKTEDGWTEVRVNAKGGKQTVKQLGSNYTQERGYGFEDENSAPEGRDEGYTQEGKIPSKVYTDLVLPAGLTFLADVENATYQVELIAACGLAQGNSSVTAKVEGQDITITHKAPSYKIGSVTVEVTDGQLNFVFPSGTYRLGGIIIRQISK